MAAARDRIEQRRADRAAEEARRRQEHADNLARVRARLEPYRFTLDPVGLPMCDLCGCLVALAGVDRHRTRCN